MNVTAILFAALIVGGVGILIGFFLGISGEKFKVEVDEKEEAILGVLPGNNCGGCGYAGCSGLAAAIAKGEAPVNQCPVGGAPVAAKIGEIMGVAAEEGERADDNERADDEAQRGRRAGAGLELLARHAHEERAEHEADDLRTDVLHLGGAVQAAGARGVAQEAGDTEAHVGGVAHRRENEGGKTDGHAREDDAPMDLFHFLSTPCSFSLVIL